MRTRRLVELLLCGSCVVIFSKAIHAGLNFSLDLNR
jgi:hypothetical protein